MSSIAPSVSTVMQGRVAWLAELPWKPRGVGLDVSNLPKTNSTSNHPFYDSNTGKWVLPTGTILAKITASGLYTVIKQMQANGAVGAGSATVVVDDADYSVVGETWTDGVLSFTIDSIDYDTDTITATAAVGGAGIADNAALYDDTDLPGAEGSVGNVVVLLEDQEYTADRDISVSTVDSVKINESAMPLSLVTANMKTYLSFVRWL